MGKVAGDMIYGLGDICSHGPALVSTRGSLVLYINLGLIFTWFGMVLPLSCSLCFRDKLMACNVSSVIYLKSLALLRISGTYDAYASTANLS